MFETELHSHTLFSRCGIHTVLEMLTAAKAAGLKALAVTDHGPAQRGHYNSTFFQRLNQPVSGIRLLKGMECNVTDESGKTDMVEQFIPCSDVLLAGLHANLPEVLSRETATSHLINSMVKNPWIDIITHPLNFDFDVDLRILAREARRLGRALELNVSKLRQGKVSAEETRSFIRICREEGCLVSVGTDAHSVEELGITEAMEELMIMENFPMDRVVNRTFESTMEWIEERRKFKAAYPPLE